MGEYSLSLYNVTNYSLMSIKIWVKKPGKIGKKRIKENVRDYSPWSTLSPETTLLASFRSASHHTTDNRETEGRS